MMMNNEPVLAAELAARRSVTTRPRLRALGLTDRMIDGLLSRGRLRAVGGGVFVDAGATDSFEVRCAVACALTGGALCFPTAGRWWGFRKTPRCSEIHVVVPWETRPQRRPGVVIHRSRQLPETDIVRRKDGIAVTTPPRTIVDAAGASSDDDVESMVEQGLERRVFTVTTLARVSLPLASTRAARRIRRLLGRRPAWLKPVRSDYELRLERAMIARGFPALVREHPVILGPVETAHPDLGVPEDRFYVEVDYWTWHSGRRDAAFDRRRDLKLRLAGHHVERVSDVAIDEHLPETVEDLWQRWQQVRGAAATSGVALPPRTA
jgi:hypothetical protein